MSVTFNLYRNADGSLDGRYKLGDKPSDRLIQWANFEYSGGFVVPNGVFGVDDINDTEGSIAFKPNGGNGSLFVVGNNETGCIAEFAIPDVVNTTDLNSLPVAATPIQNFTSAKHGYSEPTPVDMVGSLCYLDGGLLSAMHSYYPASNEDRHIFRYYPSGDLDSTLIKDGFKLDDSSPLDLSSSGVSGWVSPIPAYWQAQLGGTHLFGPADGWSVEGRNAYGPSIFAFDANLIETQTPSTVVPTEPLMVFADSNTLNPVATAGDGLVTPPDMLWNSMSHIHFGFIPNGTRTLVCLGVNYGVTGDIGYKVTTEDSGRTSGGTTPYKDTDTYNYYWLFDLNDIVAAKNGVTTLNAPRPYAYGVASNIPFHNQASYYPQEGLLRGATVADNGDVFVCLHGADTRPNFSIDPVFARFTITDTEFATPKAPIITTNASMLSVSSTSTVNISWEAVTQDTSSQPISISGYSVQLIKTPFNPASGERYRSFGYFFDNATLSISQELSAGEWQIQVRAVSNNDVPSSIASLGGI